MNPLINDLILPLRFQIRYFFQWLGLVWTLFLPILTFFSPMTTRRPHVTAMNTAFYWEGWGFPREFTTGKLSLIAMTTTPILPLELPDLT